MEGSLGHSSLLTTWLTAEQPFFGPLNPGPLTRNQVNMAIRRIR